jgi:hypothetical protein
MRFFLHLLVPFLILSATGCTMSKHSTISSLHSWQSQSDLKKLKKESVQGNGDKSILIAYYYADVKNDLDETMFWYRLSAEQGNKEAALMLGFYYSHVFKKPEKGILWYKTVGDYRPDYVHYRLGEVYLNNKSYKEARSHFCSAYLLGLSHEDYAVLSFLEEVFDAENDFISALSVRILNKKKLTKGSWADREIDKEMAELKAKLTQDDIVAAENIANSNKLCM